MKTIRLLFGIVLVLFMVFTPQGVDAHRGNHGRQSLHTPYWVPAHIVRANVRHIYFPDYNVYFDRWNGTYVYQVGRRWATSTRLPLCLQGINFARAYKVGLYLDTTRPYVYNWKHQTTYRNRTSVHYNNSYYKKVAWRSRSNSRNSRYNGDPSPGKGRRVSTNGRRN